MSAPWVAIEQLSKRFGSTTALDSVSWHGGGGVVGVLGPNGAGKSTLLRIVATVLAPDSGSVRIDGADPGRAADRLMIRRMLGYLPQSDHLYRSFTVFDLIDYVAVLKEVPERQRRAEILRVLEMADLDSIRHQRIRGLSGGTCRRVSIAAALVGDPALLVLDEPANGLDPDQRLVLRDILSEAGRRGTVLLSTHQTEEVSALCRTVLVMVAGAVVFEGRPCDLAGLADGRVWVDDRPHPAALRSWVTGDNQVRSVGTPPSGAELVAPTVDDGYLLLTRGEHR